MSQKYTGGFITKSPVAPTTTAASGIWTLDQQQQAQKAGTWPTPPLFIEDMFSTYLYTGVPGGAVTVNNGIDLSGKGGLVWVKRTNGATNHLLADTARGGGNMLESNTTSASSVQTDGAVTFNSNGFTTGSAPSAPFVSWTFREQPKFFDIVTYTGDGVSGRTLAHNLGSVPGFIVTRNINGGPWAVAARKADGNYAYGGTSYAFGFNTREPASTRSVSGLATDTTFTPAAVADVGTCNNTGQSYIAYLFAHNAGGFPSSGGGSTNAISCGSYAGTGAVQTITLGYEPQWVLIKNVTLDGSDWIVEDIIRGMDNTNSFYLAPNNTDAQVNVSIPSIVPLATGFRLDVTGSNFNASGYTYIYIAIRRGPMKPPTVGTSVFSVESYNQTSASDPAFNLGRVADMGFRRIIDGESELRLQSRLTASQYLVTSSTQAEATSNFGFWDNMVGWYQGGSITPPYSQANWYGWTFARAPGFFDQVCYSGNGSTQNITHNLSAVPEFVIVKPRNSAVYDWNCYNVSLGNTQYIALNTTATPSSAVSLWNNTTPTSTVFTVNHPAVNDSGGTYVAYLFATLAGVSKVGSYTGDNTDGRIINCGFTTGARFVLIRRTDQAGQWAFWDSARGITSGNDPYLMLNNTTAQVTGFNDVGTTSTGFTINATSPGIPVNVAGSTYIFLAIA